jgi:hypothetical protein
MVRKIYKLIILGAFIMLNSVWGIQAQLSEEAKISILTGSPGEQLYATFGHTAIRVCDLENDLDLVFNYGTFHFNTPNFYLKFARGKLNYALAVETFEHFLASFEEDERTVTEQVLILSEVEKDNLYRALLINAQPENREYQYDFFYDNCATRVRDIVTKNINGNLRFSEPDNIRELTFRKAIAQYLDKSPWVKFGLDLILGSPTDDNVNEKTIQFLPDYLASQFATAKLEHSHFSIIENESVIYKSERVTKKPYITPLLVFIVLCVLVLYISRYDFKKNRCTHFIDYVLFITVGLLGLLIVFLWFFTDHTVTGPNLNLIWANPLLLVFLFWKSYNAFYKYFAGAMFVCQLFCIVSFAAFKQHLPLELIPVWIMLMVRIFLKFSEVRYLYVKKIRGK